MIEGIPCCKMIAGLKLCVDFRNFFFSRADDVSSASFYGSFPKADRRI